MYITPHVAIESLLCFDIVQFFGTIDGVNITPLVAIESLLCFVIIQFFGTIDGVNIASVLCQDSNMKLIIDYNFQNTMFGFISYSKRERCLFGRPRLVT